MENIFSVLDRFELDEVSDLKIIISFEAFNVSKSITEIWSIATKLLNY